MKSVVSTVANLAAMVHLARHDSSGSPAFQEAARVLRLSVGQGGLHLQVSSGSLWVNHRSIHPDAPGATAVLETLLVHGIGTVDCPSDLSEAVLQHLVQVLAAPAGTYLTFSSVAEAIGAEALTQVRITAARSVPIVQDTTPTVHLQPAQHTHGGVLLAESGCLILEPSLVEPGHPTLQPRNGKRPARRVDPVEAAARERLRNLVEEGRMAITTENWEGLLRVAVGLSDGAETVQSDTLRHLHRVELRRLVHRRALIQVARLTASGDSRTDALKLIRRFGSAAAEVLMDLLVEAESLSERRAYYMALTAMPDEAAPIIIHHLSHPAWYVVRNAADLCGDLDLVKALPELEKQVDHQEERVRRSVAAALAKIGGSRALEPIRRVLLDESPSVRLRALMHLDGHKRGRTLAMLLAGMLEHETHPEVRREMLRALGRIGTSDAIQAIVHAAAPGTKLMRGKRRVQAEQRVEAVRALGLAGPAAAAALRALAKDSNVAVRDAAGEALESLKTA